MEYRNIYYDDELYHYGVLGMKWGIHRAKKKGTTYSYKSHGTKKYEKKAAKETDAAKAAVYKRRAERSAQLDKKMEASVRNSSGGKTAAKVLLAGCSGAKTYEVMKAVQKDDAKHKRAKAAAVACFGTMLTASIVGTAGVNAAMRASYIRQGEKKK